MRPGKLQLRALALLAIAACTAFTCLALWQWAATYRVQMAAETELALEKPAVTTMQLIQAGRNVYSPDVFAEPPFNLLMYTPLYHELVALLPEQPGRPYGTARAVSAFFMVAAAALLLLRGAMARKAPTGRAWNLGTALVLFAFFGSLAPVVTNTAFARQDPMALFFSAASIVLIELLLSGSARRREKETAAWAASALFAFLAIATKQSYIAAPLAVCIYLWPRNRRSLWVYGGVLVGLGAIFGIFAQLHWGDGFWWSVIRVPSSSFDAGNYLKLFRSMAAQATFVVFAAVAAWACVSRRRDASKKSGAHDFEWLFLAYFLASSAILIALLPKEGASNNYFFEPVLAGLLFLQSRMRRSGPGPAWSVCALLLGIAFARDAFVYPPAGLAFTSGEENSRMSDYLRTLRQDLRAVASAAPGREAERILVYPTLRNEITSLGKVAIFSDFYLYWLLARDRRLNWPAVLFQQLEAVNLDVVIVPKGFDFGAPSVFGAEFSPLLRKGYQLAHSGAHDYYVPRATKP